MYPSSLICNSEMMLKVIATVFGLLLIIKTSAGPVAPPSCKHNGIYGDPNDCTKFYMCSPCGPLEFYCPAGNYFDPVKKACAKDDEQKCDSSSMLPSSQDVITSDVDITFIPNNFTCMIIVTGNDYDYDGNMVNVGNENGDVSTPNSSNTPEVGESFKRTDESKEQNVTKYVNESVYNILNGSEENNSPINSSTKLLGIVSEEIENLTEVNSTGKKKSTVVQPETYNSSNILKEYFEINVTNSILEEQAPIGAINHNNSPYHPLPVNDEEYTISNDTASISISYEFNSLNDITGANINGSIISMSNSTIIEVKNTNVSVTDDYSEDKTNKTKFTDISKMFNFENGNNSVNISIHNKLNLTKEIATNDTSTRLVNSTVAEEKAMNITIVDNTDEVTDVKKSDLDRTTDIVQINIIKQINIINVTDSEGNKESNSTIVHANLAATILENEITAGDEPKIKVNITDITEESMVSGKAIDNSTVHLQTNASATIFRNNTFIADGAAHPPKEMLDKILEEVGIAHDMLQEQDHILSNQTTSSDYYSANYNTVHTTTSPLPGFSGAPNISDLIRDLIGDMEDYQELINGVKDEDLNGVKRLVPTLNNTVTESNDDMIVPDHLYSSGDKMFGKILNYAFLLFVCMIL